MPEPGPGPIAGPLPGPLAGPLPGPFPGPVAAAVIHEPAVSIVASSVTVPKGNCPGGDSLGKPCDAKRPWPQCPPQSYCFAVNTVDIGPYFCCPVCKFYKMSVSDEVVLHNNLQGLLTGLHGDQLDHFTHITPPCLITGQVSFKPPQIGVLKPVRTPDLLANSVIC